MISFADIPNPCLHRARLLQVGMSPIRTCPKGIRKGVNRACGAKGLLLLGGLCIGAGVLVSFLIHNEYPKLLNSVVVVSIPHRVVLTEAYPRNVPCPKH